MKIDQLQALDILLYKGKGFSSWLIQWGTKSPYSHVAVVVDPRINLGIESNTGHQAGVRAMDLRRLDWNIIDTFRVRQGGTVHPERVVSHLVSRLGERFDWAGVTYLGILKAASFVTGFSKLQQYNAFQKKKDYFCSELVYEAFHEGGFDIVPQIDAADITSPGDIAASPVLEKIEENPPAGLPPSAP